MLITIIFIIFVSIIISVGIYVGIIKKDKSIQNSWRNIVAQTNRRRDLIPFLIKVIRGYNSEEEPLLDALQEFTLMGKKLATVEQRALLETETTLVVNEIFKKYENFPEISNDNNYIKLQKTFFEIEQQIEVSKNYYNENVIEFNAVLGGFPTNLIAKKLNIHQRESFDYHGEYDYFDNDVELDEEDIVDENANDAVYNNGVSEEFR